MKKRNGLNMTATIAVVWVCIVVNYLLVRFEVPHAVVISVFLDVMVAITMVALASWNTKLENTIWDNSSRWANIWWMALANYVVYTIWGVSLDSIIAMVSIDIAIFLLSNIKFFNSLMFLPFYLVVLLMKRK